MTISITISRNTLSLPSFSDKLGTAFSSAKQILHSTHFAAQSGINQAVGSDSGSSYAARRQFKKNKFFFIPLAVFILLLLGGIFYLVSNANTSTTGVAGVGDDRIELKKPLAEQQLNKNFSFPLKDSSGKEVSKIQYSIEKAELRDEIIVKGQRATSVKGRTFLILPIKITNTFNAPIEINARDYVRLTVNNSREKLAPDIHNDPVEVQAISTKYTRVGFPIDDDTKSLVIHVGEINGKKENITLTLRK